jgi:serine/threonine-protein kinase
VYDAGESEGDLFIVMELVEGATLAQRIAAEAPMPEVEVVRVGAELLAALEFAHAADLVHRDVKPANVLFDRSNRVKLTDFGIAKRLDEIETSLTREGTFVGTPNYVAPEQTAGQPPTPAVDIHAVGTVLYEMLSGARPPAGGLAPPDVRVVRPDVSTTTAHAITRALSPDPQDRQSSAAEMRAGLLASPLGTSAETATAVASATAVMPQYLQPTDVLPSPDDHFVAPVHRSSRRWWPVTLALVLALGAGALVVATRDSGGPAGGALGSLDSGTTPAAEATASPTASSTAETSTESSTTAPVTTVAPTIVTTTPSPPVAEVIPGFPATNDVDQFIEQLQDGSAAAGRQSEKLGDELRKLVDGEGNQSKRADRLADDIVEWVDDGELDPEIGAAALTFLDATLSDGED